MAAGYIFRKILRKYCLFFLCHILSLLYFILYADSDMHPSRDALSGTRFILFFSFFSSGFYIYYLQEPRGILSREAYVILKQEENAFMEENKKIEIKEEDVAGGRVLASATDYDRCPMCDNPTPVINGRCKCTSCGHSWTAGSH